MNRPSRPVEHGGALRSAATAFGSLAAAAFLVRGQDSAVLALAAFGAAYLVCGWFLHRALVLWRLDPPIRSARLWRQGLV